jgi:predicted transposase YbfD/YdcC
VPTLLAGRDLTATVTTMDALLTQRSLAQQILAQHGHYLMIIKKNQPTLYEAAELVFREPPVPARPGELLSTQTANKAHGRLEIRSLASTTALNAYLSWPGVAQIMRRTCYRRNMRTGQGPNHAPHLLPPQHAYRPRPKSCAAPVTAATCVPAK